MTNLGSGGAGGCHRHRLPCRHLQRNTTLAASPAGTIRVGTVPDTRRIHAGESRAVALSFVYFFCVLAAYYVVRPVRDQLSAAVGSTQLPWFYAATFVATRMRRLPLRKRAVARSRSAWSRSPCKTWLMILSSVSI